MALGQGQLSGVGEDTRFMDGGVGPGPEESNFFDALLRDIGPDMYSPPSSRTTTATFKAPPSSSSFSSIYQQGNVRHPPVPPRQAYVNRHVKACHNQQPVQPIDSVATEYLRRVLEGEKQTWKARVDQLTKEKKILREELNKCKRERDNAVRYHTKVGEQKQVQQPVVVKKKEESAEEKESAAATINEIHQKEIKKLKDLLTEAQGSNDKLRKELLEMESQLMETKSQLAQKEEAEEEFVGEWEKQKNRMKSLVRQNELKSSEIEKLHRQILSSSIAKIKSTASKTARGAQAIRRDHPHLASSSPSSPPNHSSSPSKARKGSRGQSQTSVPAARVA